MDDGLARAVKYYPEPWWVALSSFGTALIFIICSLMEARSATRAWSEAALFGGVGFALFLLGWDSTKSVRLYRRADRLVTVHARWPLAAKSRELPLAQVCDAIVEVNQSSNGRRRVVVVLQGGKQVPLTRSFCSGRRHHDQAAVMIRSLVIRESNLPQA